MSARRTGNGAAVGALSAFFVDKRSISLLGVLGGEELDTAERASQACALEGGLKDESKMNRVCESSI